MLLEETPPLTRRKPLNEILTSLMLRNTSAYAEKTILTYSHIHYPQKHLRLRGENSQRVDNMDPSTETPPLTRRKPLQLIRARTRVRNTSAYAEKTTFSLTCRAGSRKHLRLRGENIHCACEVREVRETPPLTRRKREKDLLSKPWLGNTSAYAEKTAVK